LIQARHKGWTDQTPLFCSQDGGRLSVNSWGHIMKKYSAKIGVNITGYMLRHKFCLSNLVNGLNLYTTMQIMGHTNISTTQIYLSGLSINDIRREHQQSNLINQIAPVRSRQRKIS
jgi:site-specific recombinase XerD